METKNQKVEAHMGGLSNPPVQEVSSKDEEHKKNDNSPGKSSKKKTGGSIFACCSKKKSPGKKFEKDEGQNKMEPKQPKLDQKKGDGGLTKGKLKNLDRIPRSEFIEYYVKSQNPVGSKDVNKKNSDTKFGGFLFQSFHSLDALFQFVQDNQNTSVSRGDQITKLVQSVVMKDGDFSKVLGKLDALLSKNESIYKNTIGQVLLLNWMDIPVKLNKSQITCTSDKKNTFTMGNSLLDIKFEGVDAALFAKQVEIIKRENDLVAHLFSQQNNFAQTSILKTIFWALNVGSLSDTKLKVLCQILLNNFKDDVTNFSGVVYVASDNDQTKKDAKLFNALFDKFKEFKKLLGGIKQEFNKKDFKESKVSSYEVKVKPAMTIESLIQEVKDNTKDVVLDRLVGQPKGEFTSKKINFSSTLEDWVEYLRDDILKYVEALAVSISAKKIDIQITEKVTHSFSISDESSNVLDKVTFKNDMAGSLNTLLALMKTRKEIIKNNVFLPKITEDKFMKLVVGNEKELEIDKNNKISFPQYVVNLPKYKGFATRMTVNALAIFNHLLVASTETNLAFDVLFKKFVFVNFGEKDSIDLNKLAKLNVDGVSVSRNLSSAIDVGVFERIFGESDKSILDKMMITAGLNYSSHSKILNNVISWLISALSSAVDKSLIEDFEKINLDNLKKIQNQEFANKQK